MAFPSAGRGIGVGMVPEEEREELPLFDVPEGPVVEPQEAGQPRIERMTRMGDMGGQGGRGQDGGVGVHGEVPLFDDPGGIAGAWDRRMGAEEPEEIPEVRGPFDMPEGPVVERVAPKPWETSEPAGTAAGEPDGVFSKTGLPLPPPPRAEPEKPSKMGGLSFKPNLVKPSAQAVASEQTPFAKIEALNAQRRASRGVPVAQAGGRPKASETYFPPVPVKSLVTDPTQEKAQALGEGIVSETIRGLDEKTRAKLFDKWNATMPEMRGHLLYALVAERFPDVMPEVRAAAINAAARNIDFDAGTRTNEDRLLTKDEVAAEAAKLGTPGFVGGIKSAWDSPAKALAKIPLVGGVVGSVQTSEDEAARRRLENPEKNYAFGKDDPKYELDQRRIVAIENQRAIEAARGTTVGSTVGSFVAGLPTLLAELATIGGPAKRGAAMLFPAATRLAKIGRAGLQPFLMASMNPGRIAEGAARRSDGVWTLNQDDLGDITTTLEQAGDPAAIAAFKEWFTTGTTYAVLGAGGPMQVVAKKYLPAAVSRVLFGAYGEGIRGLPSAATAIAQAARTLGVHAAFTTAAARMADVVVSAIGFDADRQPGESTGDRIVRAIFPGWKELAGEYLGFVAFGAATQGPGMLRDYQAQRQYGQQFDQYKQMRVDAARRAGATDEQLRRFTDAKTPLEWDEAVYQGRAAGMDAALKNIDAMAPQYTMPRTRTVGGKQRYMSDKEYRVALRDMLKLDRRRLDADYFLATIGAPQEVRDAVAQARTSAELYRSVNGFVFGPTELGGRDSPDSKAARAFVMHNIAGKPASQKYRAEWRAIQLKMGLDVSPESSAIIDEILSGNWAKARDLYKSKMEGQQANQRGTEPQRPDQQPPPVRGQPPPVRGQLPAVQGQPPAGPPEAAAPRPGGGPAIPLHDPNSVFGRDPARGAVDGYGSEADQSNQEALEAIAAGDWTALAGEPPAVSPIEQDLSPVPTPEPPLSAPAVPLAMPDPPQPEPAREAVSGPVAPETAPDAMPPISVGAGPFSAPVAPQQESGVRSPESEGNPPAEVAPESPVARPAAEPAQGAGGAEIVGGARGQAAEAALPAKRPNAAAVRKMTRKQAIALATAEGVRGWNEGAGDPWVGFTAKDVQDRILKARKGAEQPLPAKAVPVKAEQPENGSPQRAQSPQRSEENFPKEIKVVWMANKESGQTIGNREIIRRPTFEDFRDEILPRTRAGYYNGNTPEEQYRDMLANHPDLRISRVEVNGEWITGKIADESTILDARHGVNGGITRGWAKIVDDFDSPVAVQHRKTFDSDVAPAARGPAAEKPAPLRKGQAVRYKGKDYFVSGMPRLLKKQGIVEITRKGGGKPKAVKIDKLEVANEPGQGDSARQGAPETVPQGQGRGQDLPQPRNLPGVPPGAAGQSVEAGAGGVAAEKAAAEPVVEQTLTDAVVSVPLSKKAEASVTMKEQKAFLLAEIDQAIAAAPRSTTEERDFPKTVRIEVPNDGIFTIPNGRKELEYAKKVIRARFPTKVPPYVAPGSVPGTEDLGRDADQALDLYGDAATAAKKIRAQLAIQVSNGELDDRQKARSERLADELESRAYKTSKPVDQKTANQKALDRQIEAGSYPSLFSKAIRDQQEREQAAVAAQRRHPLYGKLQAELAKWKPFSTASRIPGDLLNVRIATVGRKNGQAAKAIRDLQDQIGKDLGLRRPKGEKDGAFDLRGYYKDFAKEFTAEEAATYASQPGKGLDGESERSISRGEYGSENAKPNGGDIRQADQPDDAERNAADLRARERWERGLGRAKRAEAGVPEGAEIPADFAGTLAQASVDPVAGKTETFRRISRLFDEAVPVDGRYAFAGMVTNGGTAVFSAKTIQGPNAEAVAKHEYFHDQVNKGNLDIQLLRRAVRVDSEAVLEYRNRLIQVRTRNLVESGVPKLIAEMAARQSLSLNYALDEYLADYFSGNWQVEGPRYDMDSGIRDGQKEAMRILRADFLADADQRMNRYAAQNRLAGSPAESRMEAGYGSDDGTEIRDFEAGNAGRDGDVLPYGPGREAAAGQGEDLPGDMGGRREAERILSRAKNGRFGQAFARAEVDAAADQNPAYRDVQARMGRLGIRVAKVKAGTVAFDGMHVSGDEIVIATPTRRIAMNEAADHEAVHVLQERGDPAVRALRKKINRDSSVFRALKRWLVANYRESLETGGMDPARARREVEAAVTDARVEEELVAELARPTTGPAMGADLWQAFGALRKPAEQDWQRVRAQLYPPTHAAAPAPSRATHAGPADGPFAASEQAARDREYLAAVERGDMATAQRIVDEAAKRAGHNIEGWHGTPRETFTVFRADQGRTHDRGYYGDGFYFTFGDKRFSPGEAEYYGQNVIRAYIKTDKPFVFKKLIEYKGHQVDTMGDDSVFFLANVAKMFPEIADTIELAKYERNPKTYERTAIGSITIRDLPALIEKYDKRLKTEIIVGGMNGDVIQGYVNSTTVEFDNTAYGGKKGSYEDIEWLNGRFDPRTPDHVVRAALISDAIDRYEGVKPDFHPEGYMTRNPQITEAIKSRGYDSIMQSESGDEIVVFSPSKIKSAEAVVRDDTGRIIPPSGRFNPQSDDIRFAAKAAPGTEYDGATVEKYTNREGGESWKIVWPNGSTIQSGFATEAGAQYMLTERMAKVGKAWATVYEDSGLDSTAVIGSRAEMIEALSAKKVDPSKGIAAVKAHAQALGIKSFEFHRIQDKLRDVFLAAKDESGKDKSLLPKSIRFADDMLMFAVKFRGEHKAAVDGLQKVVRQINTYGAASFGEPRRENLEKLLGSFTFKRLRDNEAVRDAIAALRADEKAGLTEDQIRELDRLVAMNVSDMDTDEIDYMAWMLSKSLDEQKAARDARHAARKSRADAEAERILRMVQTRKSVDFDALDKETSGGFKAWYASSLLPSRTVAYILDGGAERGPIAKRFIWSFWEGRKQEYRVTREVEEALAAKLGEIDPATMQRPTEYRQIPKDKLGRTTRYNLSAGKTVELYDGERISIYLSTLNERNMRHATHRKGGFVLEDSPSAKPIRFSEDDMAAIAADVQADPELMKIAEAFKPVFNDLLKRHLNETSEKMDAETIADEDNYLPMVSASMHRQMQSLDSGTTGPGDIQNVSSFAVGSQGSLKRRIPNARNPLMLYDVFTLARRATRVAGLYSGFAEAIDMVKRVRAPVVDEKGVEIGTVEGAVRKGYGSQYWDSIMDLARSYEENRRPSSTEQKALSWLNLWTRGALAWNIPVKLAQAVSYYQAAPFMPAKYWWKGLFSNPASWEEMGRKNDVLYARGKGKIDIATGEAYQGAADKFGQRGMKGILEWDRKAIGRIWNAVKEWERDMDPTATDDEIEIRTGNRVADEIIWLSQPSFEPETRSRMQREHNVAVRSIMRFSSQRTKNFDMLFRAFYDFKIGKTDKSELLRKLGILLAAQIAYAALKTAVETALKRREPDEAGDQFLRTLVSAIASMGGRGAELLVDMANSAMTHGRYKMQDPFFQHISDAGQAIYDVGTGTWRLATGEDGGEKALKRGADKAFRVVGVGSGTGIHNAAEPGAALLKYIGVIGDDEESASMAEYPKPGPREWRSGLTR